MQGQSEPKREFPESEKGFEQERDRQKQDWGPGRTGTAPGKAPQNPETATLDPGKSGQNQSSTDSIVRNPSGDDLSEGIEGDEGSGRRI
jgi:hypothetical protein